MCGRYFIQIDDAAMREIIAEAQRQIKRAEQEQIEHQQHPQQPGYEQLPIKFSGEIFPTDIVPVEIAPAVYQPMRWGFTGFRNGAATAAKPIINARSETALDKPMFRESMLERRCIIPASGYYEWGSVRQIQAQESLFTEVTTSPSQPRKVKYQLTRPGEPLFLAGCYRCEHGESLPRFVILTRPAAPGIADIHDRMPVIIPQPAASDWLLANPDAMNQAITELDALQCSS
jgi:putative SOS response-associated peptidase YedK